MSDQKKPARIDISNKHISQQFLKMSNKKLAVIGGGAAGINTAWFCEEFYHIDIFEKSSRLFGHVNTLSKGDNYIIDMGAEFITDAYLYCTQIHKYFNIKLIPTNGSYYYENLDNNFIFYPQ
eukprot:507901_1